MPTGSGAKGSQGSGHALGRWGEILEAHGQLQAGGQIDLITTAAIKIVQ
jgi:hypothetical protein